MRKNVMARVVPAALACALAFLLGMAFLTPAVAWATDGVDDAAEVGTTPLAVTFYAAEAEVEGVMSDQIDWSGTGVTLAPCTYTRGGYRFAGWQASTAAGVMVYGDGATIPASDFGEEGLLQLVALWEPNTYTLVFDLAGGTMEVSSLECTYGEYVTYPVPSWPGHVFTGWALGNGVILEEGNRALLSTFDGDAVTLTATWEPTTVSLSFYPAYPGEASGPELSGVVATYGDEAVSLPALALEGYDFLGWDNGSGDVLAPGTHTMAEAFGPSQTDDATLVGVWQPHSYEVILDYAGGTAISDGMTTSGGTEYAGSASMVMAYGDVFTLPSPTLKGYVLTGWVDESGQIYPDGATLADMTTDDGGVVRLTALWEVAPTSKSEDDGTDTTTQLTPEAETTAPSTASQTDEVTSTDESAAVEAPTNPEVSHAEATVVEIMDDANATGTTSAASTKSDQLTHWLKLLPVIAIGVAAVALLGIAICLIRPASGDRAGSAEEARHFGGGDDS